MSKKNLLLSIFTFATFGAGSLSFSMDIAKAARSEGFDLARSYGKVKNYKKLDQLKRLIEEEKIDVNAVDEDGYTLLSLICSYEVDDTIIESAKLLFDKGARKSINCRSPVTALIFAVSWFISGDNKDPRMVVLLLSNGVNVKTKGLEGLLNKPDHKVMLKCLKFAEDYDGSQDKKKFVWNTRQDPDIFAMLSQRAFVKDYLDFSGAVSMLKKLLEQQQAKQEKYKRLRDCRIKTRR